MKIFLISFSFLIFAAPTFSQTTYSNSYDIAESSDNAFRVFQKDSLIFTVNLSACGTFQSFVSCTGILCTNLAGEEQWTMAIDSTGLASIDAVTITDDFLYLALQSRSIAYQGPQIYKVDFFGNIVDSANIIEAENFFVYGLYKVEDGFKIYASKSEEAPEVYAALVYLNEDYEQISLQRFTFEEMIEVIPLTIVELEEAGSNMIVHYKGTDELVRTTMIRLDTAGNVLWTYPMLGDNTPSSFNLKLLHVPNEAFYVTFVVGNSWDFDNPVRAKLAKFSENGDLIWSKVMNYIEDIGVRNSFLTSNQEIVGLGISLVDSLPGFQGYINRFDLEGNILWERKIVETNFSINPTGFFNGGIELDNNDLIFCGNLIDDDSGTPALRGNTWLVRTTADGCLDIDACDNLTPTEELSLLDQKEFILYPNPAADYIMVDADNFSNQEEWKIRVFNANGQLESVGKTRDFPHQLNTQNLAAGFYFLELENEKGFRKMLKFVRK